MDEELFERCKEVYRRFPEWKIEDVKFFVNDFGTIEISYEAEILPPTFVVCPLYTSDYLLEKLGHLGIKLWVEIKVVGLEGWWATVNGDDGQLLQNSDTPLNALLKLVIALDDAGQLVATETTA